MVTNRMWPEPKRGFEKVCFEFQPVIERRGVAGRVKACSWRFGARYIEQKIEKYKHGITDFVDFIRSRKQCSIDKGFIVGWLLEMYT